MFASHLVLVMPGDGLWTFFFPVVVIVMAFLLWEITCVGMEAALVCKYMFAWQRPRTGHFDEMRLKTSIRICFVKFWPCWLPWQTRSSEDCAIPALDSIPNS